MSPMVHKSFDVQPAIWRTLRLNAEQSGAPIRDFLAFLIARSTPIPAGNCPERQELEGVVEANRKAAASMSSPTSKPLT